MNINEIITALAVLCILSVIIGLVLSLAEKVFHINVNELEVKVREVLPGSNCGGCGYAGCDSLAKAIANGEADVSACPVGRKPVAEKIAEIMGKELGSVQKKTAYVKCDGSNEKRTVDYNYIGAQSCEMAAMLPGTSPYSCKYGCLGYGSCAKVCDQGAVKIIDNKAVIDEEICIACGKCAKVCPHKLIEIIPADSKLRVQCASNAKGKAVMSACTAGCIACGICTKNCPSDAITVENNIAKIDYNKCTHCGACVEKCPRKIIKLCE